MGSRENFVLRWNDFHENITSSFNHLRSSPDFQDVTLMCGFNKVIRAHKVILSACSPYFQSILCHIKSSNPVIVMPQDVHHEEVVSLVDFMYYGEVTMPSQDINRFLLVAEQFQVKGLVKKVSKVTAPASVSSKVVDTKIPATKRPRVVSEDLNEEDEYEARPYQPTPIGRSYQLAPKDKEPTARPYQPPPSQETGATMVGLVCPQCRAMCSGVAALKAHMRVCTVQQAQCEVNETAEKQNTFEANKKDQSRPIGQVVPAQRRRIVMKQPEVHRVPLPQLSTNRIPNVGHSPSLAIHKLPTNTNLIGTSKVGTTPVMDGRSVRHAASIAGPSKVAVSIAQHGGNGKPDLREIGQKLGLAVSITNVASEVPQRRTSGGKISQPEADVDDIKQEPAEVEEGEEAEEGQEFVDEEHLEETGYEDEMDGYENEDMEEEAEYGEIEDGYPSYDDYGCGPTWSGK